MKTRILRSVAAAAMCTAAAFGAAAQQYDFEYDGLRYYIVTSANIDVSESESVAVIYPVYPDVYSGDIVIPEHVNYNGKTYTVVEIWDNAFCESEITSVEIPNTVQQIGDQAFSYCNGLTTIEVPASVYLIGENAFSGCDKLTEINVDAENEHFCSFDGVLYDKGVTRLIRCPGAKTSIAIPSTVTTIEELAFFDCSLLKDFALPASLATIEEQAFYGCSTLTRVNLPDNLQSIGNQAFCLCENLESVSIGKNLSEMGISPFVGCGKLAHVTIDDANLSFTAIDNVVYAKKDVIMSTGMVLLWGAGGLQSVTIPDGVSSIYDSAFQECRALSSVKIPDSMLEIHDIAFAECKSLTEIEIPEKVYHLGVGVFRGCEKLSKVSFAEPFNRLVINEQMFSGCESLETITIPDYFSAIETSAFSGCSNLTSVIIGSDVRWVGNMAFAGCNALRNIYCMAAVPPSTEYEDNFDYAFEQAVCEQATLYVPMGTRADYAATTEWGRFKNIVETDFVGVEDAVAGDGGVKVYAADGAITVSGVADGAVVEVYGIGGGCVYRGTGSVVDGLSAGIYVVRAAGQVTKVVLK